MHHPPCLSEQLIKCHLGNYALRWELVGVFWWSKELARAMWAAGKALEEAAGAVPWEGDWETIASTQEMVRPSGPQVERVGVEDEMRLLWAWTHGITTEFLPWKRYLMLRNDWEGEHLSGFSEPQTCPGRKGWGCIFSRYKEGWRPWYRGWWDFAWDTLLSQVLCVKGRQMQEEALRQELLKLAWPLKKQSCHWRPLLG